MHAANRVKKRSRRRRKNSYSLVSEAAVSASSAEAVVLKKERYVSSVILICRKVERASLVKRSYGVFLNFLTLLLVGVVCSTVTTTINPHVHKV